jgi:hypothetical protein
MKAVPACSEKYFNQNRQENTASLTQKISAAEPAGFSSYTSIVILYWSHSRYRQHTITWGILSQLGR